MWVICNCRSYHFVRIVNSFSFIFKQFQVLTHYPSLLHHIFLLTQHDSSNFAKFGICKSQVFCLHFLKEVFTFWFWLLLQRITSHVNPFKLHGNKWKIKHWIQKLKKEWIYNCWEKYKIKIMCTKIDNNVYTSVYKIETHTRNCIVVFINK